MSELKSLIGQNYRKAQPKLRVVANGSDAVNAKRAGHSGCVGLAAREEASEEASVDTEEAEGRQTYTLSAALKIAPGLDKQMATQETLGTKTLVSVFVEETDSIPGARLPGQEGQRSTLRTATVSLDELRSILERPAVMHVQLGEPLTRPSPVVAAGRPSAPGETLRQVGDAELQARHREGEGVLIGIVDVGGFDFSHPDFMNPDGTTRFLRIWDQCEQAEQRTGRPAPKREPFNYGSEIRQEHMNAALAAYQHKTKGNLVIPPYELEPQSEMQPSSHGTHVASIAAGNRGVCRKAAIAGVLISIPESELARRHSFYDSTQIAHAVEYLVALADELAMPVVINISLGTNGHAHDGSAAISRWIDAAMAVPGRAVCVAAGNAGQELPRNDADLGHMVGRIHTSGKLTASGLVTDIDWIVAGNGIVDVSENELEFWFSPQDVVEVSVRTPDGQWVGPIGPGCFIENRRLPNGAVLSVYSESYHPANGANYVSIILSPFLGEPIVGIPAGRWVIRLRGVDIREGTFHGWIERDDPRPRGRTTDRQLWNFPSFFGERSNVDESSVTSLGCGRRVVCVANLDEETEGISITSSQGPTRDGRPKPDVAAPGTNIVAASAFTGSDHLWAKMSGTSMAAPYVTGTMGLMLAVEPTLTAAQLEGIIARTSRPLPGRTYSWVNNAGFGAIRPELCLKEALTINARRDCT